MTLELLLAHADARDPVLPGGVPVDAAADAPVPQDRALSGFLDHPGADPGSLPDQRWGIVAPEGGEGDRLLALIEPLRRARREQQGAEPIVLRAPPGVGPEGAARFWDEEYRGEDIDPADRPRYLLVLGDADLVSWELQQRLAADAFVGRLAFSSDDGYAAYADKVLAWERREPAAGARALFCLARDGTAATATADGGLMAPTLDQARRGREKGSFRAREIEEIGDGDPPSAGDLLARAAAPGPALLFSISHGLGAPRGAGWSSPEEQRRLQGAMSFGGRERLAAEDVARGPFLPGGAWFYFACFGAGTPATSAYGAWLAELAELGVVPRRALSDALASLPGDRGRPFVAALPQAALANPDGPLAVLGHVDLAWTFSFQDPGGRSRPSRFQGLLRALVEGARIGAGCAEIQRVLNQVSVDLALVYGAEARARARGAPARGDEASRLRKAALWMLRQDLSAYVLLGDPAARLPVASPEQRAAAAPGAPPGGAALASIFGFAPQQPAAPDPARIEAAVIACLRAEEPRSAIAGRFGVSLAQLDLWVDAYRGAGRAAVARLR